MTAKSNSLLIRLLFILIFISATAIAYILLPNDNAQISQQTQPSSKEQAAMSTPTVRDSSASPPMGASLGMTTKNEPTQTATKNFQTTTFSVNDQNYTLQFNADENLLTAMRRLETSSVAPFIFAGHEYAGLGFFVDEINGLKTDPNAGKYWLYYVNAQPAKIGISNYLLKSGDVIKWKYKG